MNQDNLRLLANRLEQLPANYGHFNMSDYVVDKSGDYIEDAEEPAKITRKMIHACGTCACAVGHAPTIRGLNARKDETWNDYITRVFGFDICSAEFSFLFASEWADEADPRHHTAHAAAKRIDLLIAHGVPQLQHWLDYIDA
jgi:hypothetical protein